MYVLPTESFQSYAGDVIVRRLYLTDIGYFPNAQYHYRERTEGIDECVLLYCSSGQGIINLSQERYVLRENEVFVIPANTPHKYYASTLNPWSIYWIHFNGEDLDLYPINEQRIIKFGTPNESNRMVNYFNILFNVLEINYTLGNFRYISGVLTLMLCEVYFREKDHTSAEQSTLITSIIKYMYGHLDRQLRLQDLSDAFNLSKSYLNQIFQTFTQHSPISFYNSIKMKEACKELRTSKSSICEVARKFGFQNQYHFSRSFKRIVGTSPSHYRKAESVFFED